MKKEEFLDRFYRKKLVIRGAGALAGDFYETYGRSLKISHCTTNCPGESIDGIPRIELDQILESREDYFIIVCVGDYESVSFQLISEGLMPGRDFFPSKVVAGLIENRKIFLAVGQCELAVTDYIYQNMSLIKEYVFLYYDEYKVLGITDCKPFLPCVLEVNVLIDLADYFIYPVNLSARGEYYNRLRRKVTADCCTVSIPLSTFEGYWPQDCAKDYYEKSPYYLTPSVQRFRRDMNIETAFENETTENILYQISSEDFYDEETVQRGFDKTIKKFVIMERKSDVKISDYYRENYKFKKLFLDRGHAAVCVLKEYAKRILESCGIAFNLQEIEAADLTWYDDCHMEFPIYPSVRKVLDLADEERYRLIDNGEKKYLSYKEYTEIIYCSVKNGVEYLRNTQK